MNHDGDACGNFNFSQGGITPVDFPYRDVQYPHRRNRANQMNPFPAYGIEHLSPSACNTFIGSPAAFVLERLLNRKSKVGAAAHRGTSVEEGVVHGLVNGVSDDECVKVAQDTFGRLTALCGDPRLEKERDAVPEMVRQGLAELRPYGKPSSTQGKVSLDIEGLHVPMIGFYDVAWEDHGILIDLKTTHALPNKIKINHARQVSLYAACMGEGTDARLTYVTPKKVATYKLENVPEHVDSLKKIALTIQRFLSVSDNPLELASLLVPDIESFYFSDPAARQAVFEVWGV
jgi:hypothetical protein